MNGLVKKCDKYNIGIRIYDIKIECYKTTDYICLENKLEFSIYINNVLSGTVRHYFGYFYVNILYRSFLSGLSI